MRKFSSALALGLGLSLTASGAALALELKSTDLAEGQFLKAAQVYQGFGCQGGNLSPQLEWSAAPAGTRSFAVTVYDPDAPTGSGWWHWSVYDLPASVMRLERGVGQGAALPAGAKQGRNDYGSYDFGGACPPVGDTPHRYTVTLRALKVEKLELPLDASPALIGFMLNAHTLASASLTARYGR